MSAIRSFSVHPSGMLGLTLLIVILCVAGSASVVFPNSPWDIVAAPFVPPATEGLLLGSDSLGRDIAAGIAHGARVSLVIGFASTLVALLFGVTVGGIAGYLGGRADDLLMRFTELFQTIPAFILAVIFVAILTPSLGTIISAIALVSWPQVARLTRGEFLSLKHRDFVSAARCQGESSWSIATRYILPNASPPIIVAASLSVASAILIESSLSFLGLGDPNLMSWGFMIGAARTLIRQAWWMSVFPGVAILLTVLAINLVGEGLNDVLNPSAARK